MTVEPPAGRPPQQRATDADRDRTFSVLHEAYADGRLDRAELDERLDQVSTSKTLAELAVVTADLQHTAQGGGSDRVVLRSTGSQVRRDGRWSVPQHLVVEAVHGRVRLDLTAAVVRHPEVLIELECAHTSVRIDVPRGWQVSTNDLVSEWGKVKDQTDSSMTGGPQLRIAGLAKHSTVIIRHPKGRRSRAG